MEFRSIKYYISALIKDGHYFQNVNAELKYVKPRFYFSSVQWIIIVCSIAFLFISKKGFNPEFCKYLMAVFGILIGMYSSLIWSVFGKFKDLKIEDIKEIRRSAGVEKMKIKEFFKQFNAVSNYLRLMCFLLIILLAVSSFVPTDKDIIVREFFSLEHIRSSYRTMFFYKQTLLLFYRATTFYFMLDFFVLSFFVFGGSYRYMKYEYDKNVVTA